MYNTQFCVYVIYACMCVCVCVCTMVHIYRSVLHFKLRLLGWVSSLPYGAISLCLWMVSFFTVPGAAYWLASKC